MTRFGSAALTIASALILGGCENLLEVDNPAELSDDILDAPGGAVTVLNSAIGHFENGYNDWVWEELGRSDGGWVRLSSGGTDAGHFQYGVGSQQFDEMATARNFGYGLHERLQDWTVQQVPERARYLAISSLYAGAALAWMGQTLCEAAVDDGPLMTVDQTLAEADRWLTQALAEIQAAGDFAVPYGISTSARAMAYGLRAQARWIKGDKAGALADAAQVPRGFTAWVTRDVNPLRRNKAFASGTTQRLHELYNVIDFWVGTPNPVTGQAWPKPIPFTGYVNLGVLPDGRAVRDDGLPIRTDGPYRTPIESTAVRDQRVKHVTGPISGGGIVGYVNAKYTSDNSSIPLVSWKEMWLIRAELEGGQKAIDLVNELRVAEGLPQVTYASATNTQQIRYMLIEERRRTLFLEGRFFSTKLKNLDVAWFPRGNGTTPTSQEFGGGVRFIMPDIEYNVNPNLDLEDRATGCSQHERPILL
jgi:hypothetical protein